MDGDKEEKERDDLGELHRWGLRVGFKVWRVGMFGTVESANPKSLRRSQTTLLYPRDWQYSEELPRSMNTRPGHDIHQNTAGFLHPTYTLGWIYVCAYYRRALEVGLSTGPRVKRSHEFTYCTADSISSQSGRPNPEPGHKYRLINAATAAAGQFQPLA